MALAKTIKEFETIVEKFNAIDEDKLMRTSLGDESLIEQLSPILSRLRTKIDFARKYVTLVSDEALTHFFGHLNKITNQCNTQAALINEQ